MKKNLTYTLLIIAAFTTALSSCIREKFKYYGYEDQLEGTFPVDQIDGSHTWLLTSVTNTFIKGNVNDAHKLLILSGNPFDESDVEILAESFTSSTISKNMTYLAPSHISSVYVAVLDRYGNYISLTKGKIGGEIDLVNTLPTGTPKAVVPQKLVYGFEANYPNPGDWDYNDLVLSLTKELTGETTVDVHVTLHAVGWIGTSFTPAQIGAAIRWVGSRYALVKDQVERNPKSTFMNAPEQPRKYFPGEWTDFQRSLNDEFVINLFDDAHLAIYKLGEDGSVYRRYFNTVVDPSSTSAKQPAKTVTYTFTFDSEFEARNFTLAELDPFIMVQYGTDGDHFWEIHSFTYKLEEVLYKYYNGAAQSYNNGFSWAVVVPYSQYRYPVEEEAIGMYKNTIISGAYQEKEHSFGEWILDRTKARDWYLYPADGGVY